MAGIKRLTKLGEGSYAEAWRVEKGPLKGKVLKRMPFIFNRREVDLLRDALSRHDKKLREMGIGSVAATPRLIHDGTHYRMVFLQEEVKPGTMMTHIFRNAPKEEVLRHFSDLLKIALKIGKNNIRNGMKIHVDLNLANLEYKDGKIRLFDSFPPLVMIDGQAGPLPYRKVIYWKEDELSQYPKEMVLNHLTGEKPEDLKVFNEIVEHYFEPQMPAAWLLHTAKVDRPALGEQFRKIVDDGIRKQFPKESRELLRKLDENLRMFKGNEKTAKWAERRKWALSKFGKISRPIRDIIWRIRK